MLKILHAADLHLDAPFRSLPGAQAGIMRAEQIGVVDALCEKAETLGVDGVLLAGDLFDGQNAFYDTAVALRDRLGALSAKVLIAPGNHDHLGAGSPYRAVSWPDNVHIFRTPALTRAELCGVPVYGAAFVSPWQERSPLAGFAAEEEISIGLLHGEMAHSGRYHPIRETEVAESGLSYLALGHIHAFSGFQRAGKTLWCQPGCAAGRGFDETGVKGAALVTIDENGRAEGAFIPLPARRYQKLTLKYPGGDRDAAAQALISALPKDVAGDILQITVCGTAPDRALEKTLAEALRETALYAEIRFAEAETAGDRWALADDSSLAGIAMGRLHERFETAAAPEEKARLSAAADFLYAAVKNSRIDPTGGMGG